MLLIVSIPPNNSDSMTYHLSRIAYWLQNQSLGYYYTHNIRQTSFPFNAEILCLWTMIASKLDHLVGFIQFICYLLSGTIIFRCLREYLRVSLIPALTVVLIWYSLPENVLQSTTPQNDLVVSYFIIANLTYLLFGLSGKSSYLVFSGITVGLAVGTKITAILYFCPLTLFLLYIIIRKKHLLKKVGLWFGTAVVSLMIVGSYSFIQNYIYHNAYLGRLNRYVLTQTLEKGSSVFLENLFNFIVNQTGLEFYISTFSDYYNVATSKAGEAVFKVFHILPNVPDSYLYGGFFFNNWAHKFKIHEDFSFFGSVGLILLGIAVYVLIFEIIKFIRKKTTFSSRYFIFAYLCLSYLLILSFVYKWDPWLSRYFVSMVLIAIPLLAKIFNSDRETFKRLGTVIIIYSVLFLIPTTFMNQLKPLNPYKRSIGDPFWYLLPYTTRTQFNTPEALPQINGIGWAPLSWNRDYEGLRYLLRPREEKFIRNYEALIPENSRVGVILGFYQWDYPLFGNKLNRTIIPVNTRNIQDENFNYLVVSKKELQKRKKLKKLVSERYVKKAYIGWTHSGEHMNLYIPKNKDRIGWEI